MDCTSVFMNCSCFSADSFDFAISRAALNSGAFPTLKYSLGTRSECSAQENL